MNAAKSLAKLNQARRIGIVRTDRLGDMVLTLPLARVLKERYPQTSIEMICRSYVSPLLTDCPVLDAVHEIDNLPLPEILRQRQFDALFFPRPVLQEAWQAFSAGVPLRVGSAYRWYSALFNARIHDHRKESLYHEAEYNVRMLTQLNSQRAETRLVAPIIRNETRQSVREILQRNGLDPSARFIVLHPGSGGSAREWSVENFADVGTLLERSSGRRILVTGTASESGICQTLVAHCSEAINLSAQLDLSQLIALLSMTDLILAHSTGVLHIGAALSTPVVGLYPNTAHISARRWGPYSERARVVSPPQQSIGVINDTMSDISIKDVVDECLELLSDPETE